MTAPAPADMPKSLLYLAMPYPAGEAARLDAELAKPDIYASYASGSSACGTPETFQHYVDELKAAG